MLFCSIFGKDFYKLPATWQQFHTVENCHVYEGMSAVERGEGLFVGLLCRALGFPPTSEVPVRLIVERRGEGERWQRVFGSSGFSTTLIAARGEGPICLYECLFPFRFCVELIASDNQVSWRLVRWWFLGLPLPRFLMPRSQTVEFVDEKGRYSFDIQLDIAFFGPLIAYRGWLLPAPL